MRILEAGQVFFLPFCRHAKPAPKDKLVLLTCVKPTPLGLFINSRISPFVRKQPHLMQCHVLLEASQHDFLEHDSYVGCTATNLYMYSVDELVNYRGIISHPAREQIIAALKFSTDIEPLYKTAMLSELEVIS
jgi:hypothetical protein